MAKKSKEQPIAADPIAVFEEMMRCHASGDRAGVGKAADALIGWYEREKTNPFRGLTMATDLYHMTGGTQEAILTTLRFIRTICEMR